MSEQSTVPQRSSVEAGRSEAVNSRAVTAEAAIGPQASGDAGRRAGGKALLAIGLFLLALVLLNVFAPAQAYLWLKAFHVVSIIAWMAGLLYLPRLFVYHTDAAPGSPMSETFSVMETRLMKVIMTPAMIVSWVLGLWLGWLGGWFAAGWGGAWLYAKIALVVGLSAAHMHFAAALKGFRENTNTRTARYWRMVNEVPTLLMLAIVVLVIVVKDW